MSERLTERMTVVLSKTEAERLRYWSHLKGQSVSEYIRAQLRATTGHPPDLGRQVSDGGAALPPVHGDFDG